LNVDGVAGAFRREARPEERFCGWMVLRPSLRVSGFYPRRACEPQGHAGIYGNLGGSAKLIEWQVLAHEGF
jgi:hypothetical protein